MGSKPVTCAAESWQPSEAMLLPWDCSEATWAAAWPVWAAGVAAFGEEVAFVTAITVRVAARTASASAKPTFKVFLNTFTSCTLPESVKLVVIFRWAGAYSGLGGLEAPSSRGMARQKRSFLTLFLVLACYHDFQLGYAGSER